jgi:hypothetical protein
VACTAIIINDTEISEHRPFVARPNAKGKTWLSPTYIQCVNDIWMKENLMDSNKVCVVVQKGCMDENKSLTACDMFNVFTSKQAVCSV